jgi:adenylate cyclase
MLTEKVYQFEGMVDKITGDGLMALFGAPIALENPAERAVRAALEMQAGLEQLNRQLDENLGECLHMHWGLNRGTVIVGGIGSDLLVDYTAIGDSVNLARRLQEVAPEDAIYVSESVFRTTRSLFDYQEIPDLDLKGYPSGMNAYQVLGVRAAPGRVRGIQGLHAPMIGREAELHQVARTLEEMLDDSKGHLVTLIGEAGIGKSRLTAEFKAGIDQDRVQLLEGQSLTYRKSVSYWIFLDLLRNYLGVMATSSKGRPARFRIQQLAAIIREAV